MIKLLSLFPLHCNNTAVSHIFLSVCGPWQTNALTAQMLVPSCSPQCRQPSLMEAIPPLLQRFYYRFPQAPRRRTDRYFLKHFQAYDAVYLWPGTSLEVTQQVKASGKPIFLERFNCFQGKAKVILDELYARIDREPQHPITAASIHHERSELALADYIFCPSPEVKRSLLEIGIAEQKLISSSYGWEPDRFRAARLERVEPEDFTVLFVGSICMRKGAHVLLRVWEKAAISGRLILCGDMESAIAQSCASILKREDVQHVPFTPDVSRLYARASVFAFPSFEEGSPLVTYEAMAHGLPILTSPMGSAGVVRHGMDGFILPPDDDDAWVEALRTFAHHAGERTRLGTSARKQVQEYTWEKVSARRAAQIVERVKP
ncbi:glycosyltransferase family 4 protein [Altericista sp. CCNU0014]|uniref:glycosyltransferase family 4 protein n=1 Tax=Altericista sp. CCNU0014 TaxID=3082949 RepID=UPI00384ED33C